MKAFIVFACFTLLIPPPAQGQDRPRLFVESTFGLATGRTSGEYRNNRTGLAADLMIGARPGTSSGWVVGASISAQGGGPVDDECVPASTGGCVPSFPSFVMLGLPLGYESSSDISVRLTASPVIVRPDFDNWTLGLQGRVDSALPIVWRISGVVSGRVALIPDYNSDSFRLYAFGFGLRLH